MEKPETQSELDLSPESSAPAELDGPQAADATAAATADAAVEATAAAEPSVADAPTEPPVPTVKRQRYFSYYIGWAIISLALLPAVSTFCIYIIGDALYSVLPSDVSVYLAMVPILLLSIAIWLLFLLVIRKKPLPPTAFARYAPVLIWLSFNILVFNLIEVDIAIQLQPIQLYSGFLFVAVAPHFLLVFGFSMGGRIWLYFIVLLCEILPAVPAIWLAGRIRKQPARYQHRMLVISVLTAIIIASPVVTYLIDHIDVLPDDREVERVGNDLDLWVYEPSNLDNILEPTTNPSLRITSDYPRLDGATAAYPIYATAAVSVYDGLAFGFSPVPDPYSENSKTEPEPDYYGNYINCSTTPYAYDALIAGDCDVTFAYEPSAEQLQAAADASLELEMTPIAQDAFVFIVNVDNPVDSLTVEQVREIYEGKITNWKQVGGNNEKILAFQREVGSGSQTIMLSEVMQGREMVSPPKEETYFGMSALVVAVAADYRNYAAALGYSFRFYVSGMQANPNVKMLAIDGVEPTVANIESGRYPFIATLYAVTTSAQSNPHTDELIQWLAGSEGQALVRRVGYAGYAGSANSVSSSNSSNSTNSTNSTDSANSADSASARKPEPAL
ncbi:MAG: substrate-binding domain-containing protein [Coriobacteriales bacterium]|jgi:phosphate transport system substrate-binding protein|nr:substrate-binding domain-containing protein [Coriobacteriales bacterium]